MSKTIFEYTGTSNLEVMQEAVRYNSFLVSLILNRTQSPQKMLDIGAGIGVLAEKIRDAGHTVVCMEPDVQQAAILKAKGFEVYTSLDDIPDENFDWVYAFNVLEHIADDKQALKEWCKKLRTINEGGGKILVYVPAFKILFSSMDRQVGHFRRYRKKELTGKIRQTGLVPAGSAHYADSLGFLAALIYKLTNKSGCISRKNLIFYDRYCFPLSRIGDLLFGKLFGKNVWIIAEKACVSENNK
ncbi:MAG: class I SAM-dependent methyltransferase [Tannerella sp.]|jgi:SAM-dependent methyltransferase|nr:class I SAM-dependent methyltransferase [Tannerella sp.]